MEIKSRISSSVQQKVTPESAETKSSTPAVNPSFQTGIANTRDGFESGRSDPPQYATAISSDVGRLGSSSKLDFVKQRMTNFISSNTPATTDDSIFSVMLEYAKSASKEAREDQKISRGSADLEIASKKSKLSSDAEIGTAQGSRDMYQVIDHEATTEFLIGQSSKMLKGDVHNDINTMSNQLEELKKSADDIKEKILQNTGNESDKDNVKNRYEMIVSWINTRDDD